VVKFWHYNARFNFVHLTPLHPTLFILHTWTAKSTQTHWLGTMLPIHPRRSRAKISANQSVNIQEVIAQYLPAAPPLQPATAVDTRAIPHSLLILYADHLTDQALDEIEQSSNVVAYWRFNNETAQGTNLVIAPDVDDHRQALGRQLEGDVPNKPIYWHLQIESATHRHPPLPPNHAQMDMAMIVSDHVGLFASAHDLRLATVRQSSKHVQHVSNAYNQLDHASRAGICYYFLTSSIPFGLHHFQFKDHGGHWHNALVVHEQIGPLGPWIITEYPDSDVMEEKPKETMGRIYKLSYQIRIKDPIRVKLAPLRHDVVGLPDITPQGTMTARLRLRIRETLAEMRLDRFHTRYAKAVPATITGCDPIGECLLFVSVTPSDRARNCEVIFAQVIAMIENPPPGFDSHFTNVARIQIMIEICQGASCPVG